MSANDSNPYEAHLKRLRPAAREAIGADLPTRLSLVFRDKFIVHAQIAHALDQLRDSLARPLSERPPGFALVGPSGCGKTALVNQLCREAAARQSDPGADSPILLVKTISRATEPRTWLSVARALQLPMPNSSGRVPMDTGDRVIRRIKARNIRMVVFSQFSHVEPVPREERRHVYDMLQSLSDEGVSIVILGLPSILDFVSEEEELVTRLRPLCLGPLPAVKQVVENAPPDKVAKATEFQNFLMALESFYPFAEPSELFEFRRAQAIHKRTGGLVGKVVELVNEGAGWAAKKGLPRITDEALARCAFTEGLEMAVT